MIPGKENFVYFEQLAKNQKQIYSDSCDYGIDLTPEISKNTKFNIDELKKIYKFTENSWKGYVLFGKSISFNIPFEYENNIFIGINLKISYTVDKRKNKKYLTIDITRKTFEDKPFI